MDTFDVLRQRSAAIAVASQSALEALEALAADLTAGRPVTAGVSQGDAVRALDAEVWAAIDASRTPATEGTP